MVTRLSAISFWHGLAQLGSFFFIDDYCQYWLNEEDGILTSPNFKMNYKSYLDMSMNYMNDDNLNCTWILNADEGFYITLEFRFIRVNNDINDICV